ncbi:hypothetical protein F2P56_009839 [Juglans regia]|uniref:UPF0481 protein At3g47200-like n=2 Tax=Juglans regia TaxID=51240 RepID=A0A2I4HRC4_JUGRE|nr:UPF0481 protein At3g47200-like [Juglans regia]KAF5473214.1 hypothetical protein F2P56_009839 [Juglans regia]
MAESAHEAQSDAVPTPTVEERLFEMFEDTKNQTQTDGPPKIQKVIFLLRDHKHFVKHYEPRVVSLGPIHHGNKKYQLSEKFKLRLAREFVKRSGNSIKDIFMAIKKKITELRDCYEVEVNEKYKNDVVLTWILVIDGSAILQYICSAVADEFKKFKIKADSVAFCQQDLFLLENQVPYRLLEELMSLSEMKEKLEKSIDEFIKRNLNMRIMNQQSSQEQAGESGKSKKPTHLLDLLRTSLLGPARKPKEGEQSSRKQQKNKTKNDRDWQSYRNMQELIAAGIHVKRSEDNSLRGISFSRKFNFYPGFLSLPPLIVDDSTGPKFLNLIAYEMCLDFQNDFGITSYISFLDSLIDEANDVKELRKARVLFNLLGSDEEVARLFNEIGTDLVPNIDEYDDVKWQIQEYYDKTWVTWVAEFFHNHFSSPWTLLAFFGALFALALSATQTWYAVDSPPSPCDKFCEKFNQNLRKG